MKKVCAIVFLALIAVLGIGTSVRVVVKVLPEYFLKDESKLSIATMIVFDTDRNLQREMLFHHSWIDLFGGVMRLTGADMVADAEPEYKVFKMRNEGVTFIVNAYPPLDENQLASIRDLKAAADTAGAESWFVCIPQKSCTREDSLGYLLRGVIDYAEQVDAYRKKIFDGYGFSVLDLVQIMHKTPGLHEALYFRTDHHWTPDAGRWAAGQIARVLSLPTEPLDASHFSDQVYSERMFGSQGERCGRFYCKTEKMTIPVPQTDAQITLDIDGEPSKTGRFEDVMRLPENDNRSNGIDFNLYAIIPMFRFATTRIRTEKECC